jgi:Na+/proline symporter
VSEYRAFRTQTPITGLMGAVSSFGAMLFDLMVGSALTHSHSYSLVLISAGLLHLIAFLLILLLIPRIEPVRAPLTSGSWE